jgi:hypothetical protein
MMTVRSMTAGLLVASMFLVPATGLAQESGAKAQSEDATTCQLTIEPSWVAAGAKPAMVTVSSSEIGAVKTVSIETTSGISVAKSEATPDGNAKVQLDVQTAVPGKWEVRATGDEGTCTGTLTVNAQKPGGAKASKDEGSGMEG